jgi:5-methyltetrahydropteroyltriglutamate--homocysteine methyltransferase
MKTYAYGFPRLGADRQFKKQVEAYWAGSLGDDALSRSLSELAETNRTLYAAQVERFPDGEMTFYDPLLDAAILCGLYDPKDLRSYYELCRGAEALEMTKWFNTNYHYLVPDLGGVRPRFRANRNPLVLGHKSGSFPQIVGPFTLLKLSKGISKKDLADSFEALVGVYQELISAYPAVQLDEPAFVLDLDPAEVRMIQKGYERLGRGACRITLMTYYDSVDFIAELVSLPVAAIGLDLVRGKANLEHLLKNGFPSDKTLIAGLIDGRNVWKNDIAASAATLRSLSAKVPDLAVSNAGPLYHLPFSVEPEDRLPAGLKEDLAFAKEKLVEIRQVADAFEGRHAPAFKKGRYGKSDEVQRRVLGLKERDFKKAMPLGERRKLHDEALKLPLYPTTTIGSFPQTPEVRRRRAELVSGRLGEEDHRRYVRQEIERLVEFQEKLGLDVLVHGEYERTDMVEFFAQKLEGIATTRSGWILSYGTRTYRPPIIFGDVHRPKPMTVDEIRYAQSLTKRPMKGMLTGAVTILAWSFCRQDAPLSESAYQIGLCLKDEIVDLERAGIRIVQVDEAAFRELAPIKRAQWKDYFDWAVRSFNLATNTDPGTQIHTHMCYSEFGEIMGHIDRMEFDVISIEASRSKGDIIASFENIDFQRQIGLGVWDIHSPAVPSSAKMADTVRRSVNKVPKRNFWLNPDCGLKTRGWAEVEQALGELVATAKELRKAP